jgi:type IX secretion system PorP/SprF family membrane protein
LQNKYNDEENVVYTASREERHYFVHGAMMVPVAKNIVFKPGFTTIMVAGAPITADIDMSFLFANQIWFGAMYRISDAVGAYVQYEYKNMKLGVAYDYTHTRLRKFQNGTFEVMLRIDFKTKSSQVFPSVAF